MADAQAEFGGCEDSLEPRSGPSSARSRRACDACHTRKIRCNKESPCAYCSRAGVVCTLTADQPREKRTRILLTPQYEKKLDRMEGRLDDVVEMLEELRCNMPTNLQSSSKTERTPEDTTPPTEKSPGRSFHSVGLNSTKPSSQSDSTMAAHSEFAHDFIQKTVTTDPSMSHNPEMHKAFTALKDTIRSFGPSVWSTESSFPHATPIQRPSLRGCELPPVEKVVELIRNPNYQHVTRTLGMFHFLPMDNLADLSLGVYFSQDCSETDFVTVNVGLHYLFQAYSSMATETERGKCLQFADMCRNNIDTGLSILPLYMPPTAGAITALLAGVYYAVDISQPHLAWTLVTKASEMCQTLGYHHVKHNSEDSKGEASRKQRLFWLLYLMDKSLSLRLSRASTIQDWDVTIPLPESTTEDRVSGHAPAPYLGLGVKIARCQGDIHELLYSSTALALPDHVRHSRIKILEKQLGEVGEEIRAKAEKLNTDVGAKDSDVLVLRSCDVAHMSLLTLVYREFPRLATSSIFNAQCVENARATLERLHRFLELLQNQAECAPTNAYYSVLCYSPISFNVVFCNTIETLNHVDLACLRDFNALLMIAAPSSGPIARMQQFFQALYDVALQYVEFRTAHGGSEQIHANTEMDSCLSMLGISVSELGNQQQPAGDLGQSFDGGTLDRLEGGRNRRESMNPLVWMDNMFQPDDLLLW